MGGFGDGMISMENETLGSCVFPGMADSCCPATHGRAMLLIALETEITGPGDCDVLTWGAMPIRRRSSTSQTNAGYQAVKMLLLGRVESSSRPVCPPVTGNPRWVLRNQQGKQQGKQQGNQHVGHDDLLATANLIYGVEFPHKGQDWFICKYICKYASTGRPIISQLGLDKRLVFRDI